MMNIHIVTIAYGLADDTDNLVRNTRSDNHDLTWHVFLHSQFADVVDVCNGLGVLPYVLLYPYGENRGVAKSWNEGILAAYGAGADMVIIANDDITVPDGDLDKLIAGAAAMPDRYLVTCSGYHQRSNVNGSMELGFAVFNRIALDVVGMFDEQFMPMYYEDIDYFQRARCSGLQKGHVDGTALIHKGSANIYMVPGLMAQNNQTFAANQRYYIRKWGGMPGKERHRQPFNDVRFGLRIAASDRDRPYWGYERNDWQQLVRM